MTPKSGDPEILDHMPADRRSLPLRAWLATPDWVFRALGAVLFLGLIATSAHAYIEGFWRHGTYYEFDSGLVVWIPWRILVDATYLLIAISFIFRLPPRVRSANAREIVLPFIAAFWPFLPLVAKAIVGLRSEAWNVRFESWLWNPEKWAGPIFLVGSAFIVVGNLLDVWGYGTLFRSLSISAEARELKVTGPYRIVRHPIYLGQILAQGGIWLFYARTHLVWIGFYACFVAMQLYRSRIEDGVLERAFGDRYRAWKKKTFWFV